MRSFHKALAAEKQDKTLSEVTSEAIAAYSALGAWGRKEVSDPSGIDVMEASARHIDIKRRKYLLLLRTSRGVPILQIFLDRLSPAVDFDGVLQIQPARALQGRVGGAH